MPDIDSGRRRLLLIHHSHTDVGYTALQSTVEQWQADFIRQALAIIARDPEAGFVWNCETFWGVERFLSVAGQDEKGALARAVADGRIGLSGNYLNFSELLDMTTLTNVTARARDYGLSIGVSVDSAMTADINGFGWGFAEALAQNDIINLITCIHTHHGMYPLGKRFVPFWWESPTGRRILVFNGEHYHYGNELGLAPAAVSSYTIKDDCDADLIFKDHWTVAQRRIPRFWERLEREDYPFEFVPVMISGLRTDNGPPNAAIAACAGRWNEEHADVCRIEMVTLSQFFDLLRRTAVELPVYRGDWPDWWTDGAASFPNGTRLFRQAQRTLHTVRSLTDTGGGVTAGEISEIETNLALYAEHTFSHADSMSSPWAFPTLAISAAKQAYAARASDESHRLLERRLRLCGKSGLTPGRPLVFRVVNPYDHQLDGVARLTVGHYEYHELGLHGGAGATVVESGEKLTVQTDHEPGGIAFGVPVTLAEHGSMDIQLDPIDPARSCQPANDSDHPDVGPIDQLTTPFVQIRWRDGDGINEWIDNSSGRSLLRRDRVHAPFALIHELTPAHITDGVCSVRGAMGLNRKGEEVIRRVATFESARLADDGDLFCTAELKYSAPGISDARIMLRAYRLWPRVDVTVRLAKDQDWQPENLFLSLPFGLDSEDTQIWLHKAGGMLRPRIDQIPGTLIDYYSLQDGFAAVAPDIGVAVAMLDSNLLQLGPLENGIRRLHDPNCPAPDSALPYAWLMTNYWETNFGAGLGGFYEFRFFIMWGADSRTKESAQEVLQRLNLAPVAFRLSASED
ncbi:MAG: glycoside hydrolase [bacterium]